MAPMVNVVGVSRSVSWVRQKYDGKKIKKTKKDYELGENFSMSSKKSMFRLFAISRRTP